MKQAKLILDRDYRIGEIDPRLYGSFLEHLGRAIYGGIWELGHPTADEEGFRTDVIEMVKRLQLPVVRYPGGNFVSGFNWEDSVGPDRPKRLDLAWKTTETNEVGLHEFCSWCQKAGTSPMYAVNLGTRGPENARDIVEYCNHPGGTLYSDRRIANGKKEPLDIRLWCLGNEMDGPWQMGHKEAHEYGRTAAEAAKLMKGVDPGIELVVCGSSGYGMSTFGAWEWEVLNECYDRVDYISLHSYWSNAAGDSPSFLANTVGMEDFIRSVIAVCDAVRGRKHAKKKINLSFDEWNVWYHSREQDREVWKRDKWGRALPLLEDVYNFEDALLCGGVLTAFMRHADRVKIACMAQLVNVIAPIMTRPSGACWAQTTYWPLLHASRFGRGQSLLPLLDSPKYECGQWGSVDILETAAVLDEKGGVNLFCLNRGDEDCLLEADLRSFGAMHILEHILLHHDDPKAVNTAENPMNVAPQAGPGGKADGGRISVMLPGMSWSVIRLAG